MVYHVTIPRQPSTSLYHEAIIKLTTPCHVIFATPSSNTTLFSIPHSEVRRLGCHYACGYSIIWFEICQNSRSDQFFFVAVPSGFETAKQIVQEVKVAIQNGGRQLILEDSGSMEVSYIARKHYGCREYPIDTRNQIMQTALCQIPPLSPSPLHSPSPSLSSGRFFSTPLLPTSPTDRVRKEPLHASNSLGDSLGSTSISGVSLEEFGRRKNLSSRRPPPSSLVRRPTLDKFVRQSSTSSFDSQASGDHSQVRTPTQDMDMLPLSFLVRCRHEEEKDEDRGEGHFSSSSGSDSFDSSYNSTSSSRKKLPLQASSSSHNLTSSSNSHNSHNSLAAESLTTSLNFTHASREVFSRPVVPPRSMISLKDGAYFAEMTIAH